MVSAPSLAIAPLAASQRAAAAALLVESRLPIDDLDSAAVELFAATCDGELAGVIGLERCGQAALLRSLAVPPARRGTSVGRQLCAHVRAHARRQGHTALYLLTTSAADYFARLGFTVVERGAVPAEIRATAQFAGLCPSSATVMHQPLAP